MNESRLWVNLSKEYLDKLKDINVEVITPKNEWFRKN